MKKPFLFAIGIFLVFISNAQIVLQQTYQSKYIYPGCFSSGSKYVVVPFFSLQNLIEIYNLDHTLYKTIHVASQGDTTFYIEYVADDLFDKDSTNFEYLMLTSTPVANRADLLTIKIYREDSTLIFKKDSVQSTFTYGGIASQDYNWFFLQNDSGVFLQIYTLQKEDYLYKLPGQLHHCNGDNLITGMVTYHNGNGMQLSNPIPNPTQNSTTISYQMPSGVSSGILVFYDLNGNEVKQFKVGNAFQNIEISTSELPQGTYLYNLQASSGYSSTKKMIVIR